MGTKGTLVIKFGTYEVHVLVYSHKKWAEQKIFILKFITKGSNLCIESCSYTLPNSDKMFLLFQILKFYFNIGAIKLKNYVKKGTINN